MLSGQRAFHAETSAETLTAILKSDPPELPASIEPAVRQTVLHCIEKDPASRFQSANDLAFTLGNLGGASTASQPVIPIDTGRGLQWRWWMAAAFASAVILGAAAMRLLLPVDTESAKDQVRFVPFATDPEIESSPRFSPDAKSIAYQKRSQILVRALDSPVPTELTQRPMRAHSPFWSADGALVYFSTVEMLFAARELWRVSSAGGKPSRVLDRCASPILSPDGKTLVFSRKEKDGSWRLKTSSPPGAEPKPMPDSFLRGAFPDLNSFSPDGQKFVVRVDQEVWLVPFPSGTPARLRQFEPADVFSHIWWFPDNHHVMYLSRTGGLAAHQIELADTKSNARRTVLRGPETVVSGDLSPDGRKFVYSTGFLDWDIVEFGIDGKRRGNLVATSRTEFAPSWSPRGDQLVYMSDVLGPIELWIRSADGQKTALLVRASLTWVVGSARFSRDGRRVAYIAGNQMWVVPASGGSSISVFKGTELPPSWSPDGEFLVVCDGSQILKVPASGNGTPAVLKKAEIFSCTWSPDGQSIAYSAADGMHLLAADGSTDRLLFGREHRGTSCDFTSDGKLYICAEPQNAGGYRIVTWDIATGSEIKSVALDLDQSFAMNGLSLHPDGTRFAAGVGKVKYDLWIAEGFAQPATGLARLFHHWTVPPAQVAH